MGLSAELFPRSLQSAPDMLRGRSTARPIAVADHPGAVPERLLAVRDLTIGNGAVTLVSQVSLEVHRGETLCLVGESGCGKSLTCLATLGLLPGALGVESGDIRLFDVPVQGASEATLNRIRGGRAAMIFQDPTVSLNPVQRVGRQITEAIRIHEPAVGRGAAERRAIELLDRVGIVEPARRMRSYPHELSGGMCQRVMIAMALACNPELLIADEPTTALDVTIQAQILALLKELQRATGMALLLVTHDLGVVAETADRVAVMYAGRLVETAPVDALFERPRHPYTRALLECRTRARPEAGGRNTRLPTIEGTVPDPARRPAGCAFAPRCECAQARCRVEEPRLAATGPGARAACHFPAAI
ncbi:ABC transporter ATP-binding protein [Dongia sedimenti]|uniref:ABC transporter ATP-binding protein n=1 Tax=Dongia sedimenti TaxID=3064282 RepID=A0ABU0YQS5_9PROT|nr:ABC transporter ATP-binding protein [Rhodospirillaceae bacterium R-7]